MTETISTSAETEKENVTWDMLTKNIGLSKLQIRGLLNILSAKEPAADEAVPADLVAALLTAELLEKLRLTAEQRNLIISETRHAQEKAASGFAAQLCLVDGNYCVATGLAGFLDLGTGDLINDELKVPPLETIAYNLLELYRRGQQKILQRSRLNADTNKDTQRNMDQPADVRDSSADIVS